MLIDLGAVTVSGPAPAGPAARAANSAAAPNAQRTLRMPSPFPPNLPAAPGPQLAAVGRPKATPGRSAFLDLGHVRLPPPGAGHHHVLPTRIEGRSAASPPKNAPSLRIHGLP